MSNRRHVTILEKGVEFWNGWRSEHPEITPDLSDSNIKIRELAGVNFERVNLRGALMPGANLRKANLKNADLSGADLMESNLEGAVFTGANLQSANMMGANLKGARLKKANLSETILYRADLKDSECVCSCLWFKLLMDFADRLMSAEASSQDFYFKDVGDSFVENSFVSTKISRLEIELSAPVSTRAVYEILGALNRLYKEVSQQDLLGPIIKIGSPG
jgi:hypothetical protein